MDIETIICSHINKINRLNYMENYYQSTYNFCNKYNINRETLYHQKGGLENFEVKKKDILYRFEYFESNNGNNTIIIIGKTHNNQQLDYLKDDQCALLSYDNNANDVLNIMFFKYNPKCINTEPKIKTRGTDLLKMIIKFAKISHFKKIMLEDRAEYICSKNDIMSVKYELKYMHTLTNGQPWYANFGFVFIGPDENSIMEDNKAKIINKKTSDLQLDILIYLIIRNIVINKHYITYPKYDFLMAIYDVMNIYQECVNKDIKLCDFFNIILKKHCFLMGCIYMDIYDLIGFKRYNTYEMIMHIRPEKTIKI